MMRIIYMMLLCALAMSCTKDNYIDTGISDGTYDGSMMEYLQSNSYDWDSTCYMIERANLTSIFEGTHPDYDKITFLGFTNHSIRAWMLKNNYTQVKDIPVEKCVEFVKMHIIKKEYLKADIPLLNPDYNITEEGQDGGIDLITETNKIVFAYTIQLDYAGVPKAGPILLQLFSKSLLQKIPVASPDIKCDNGVVHSLNYNYPLGEL